MHRFEVWAPNSGITQVDTMIGDTAYPMTRDSQGSWRCAVTEAGPGTIYSFRLNGDPGQVFPDPRSQWQAAGSHGPSTVPDHSFAWTDHNWRAPALSTAVLYEVHTGTFTEAGTFVGAIEKLPYLKALGVTHIELMPVHQASGTRGWGYDGVFLFAPYSAYGSPADLKSFVNACHAGGIAVFLDVVYNHLGPEGDHTGKFGPYTKPEQTPWGQAVNLDGPGSDNVRGFVIDNALMWLETYHFDGLRIDAMDELRDRSAFHFMEELTEAVAVLSKKMGRPLPVTAEFDQNDPRVVRAREQGGLGLDAQWADNFHHALITALTKDNRGYYQDFGSMALLGKALRQAIVFDGQYSAFRNKRLGRAYGKVPPDRFIVFSANHDQVGNRPLGDRPAHRMGPERVKIAAALVILSRFVPMLFQGEEWNASTPFQYFTDHRDPDIAAATIKGRTFSFFGDYGLSADQIPNPQDPETFRRSKLNWEEREGEGHRDMYEWHKSLIALRHSIPNFGRSDDAEVDFDEGARWITMSHNGVTVVCNMSDKAHRVPLRYSDRSVILQSRSESALGREHITMPEISIAVLVIDEVRERLHPDFGKHSRGKAARKFWSRLMEQFQLSK